MQIVYSTSPEFYSTVSRRLSRLLFAKMTSSLSELTICLLLQSSKTTPTWLYVHTRVQSIRSIDKMRRLRRRRRSFASNYIYIMITIIPQKTFERSTWAHYVTHNVPRLIILFPNRIKEGFASHHNHGDNNDSHEILDRSIASFCQMSNM